MSNYGRRAGYSYPPDPPWYPDAPASPEPVGSGAGEDVTAEYDYLGPAPAASPRQDRTGIAITVVVVLVVMFCVGTVMVLRHVPGSTSAASVPPSATPADTQSPAMASPGVASPGAPSDGDPSVIVPGQCVVNDGTADHVKLRIVGCGPGTYQVTSRFDSTDDMHKCKPGPGFTQGYYYQTTPRSLDFVLCLKKR